MTVDEQARTELKAAWEKYKTFEPAGLEFGEVCYRWHKWYTEDKPKDKGDRIRFMWKDLGIPHTTAYLWKDKYAESIGKGKTPEVERYTEKELEHSHVRAENEQRLEKLFAHCGFKSCYIKQNCATNEYHFNVIFSALTEAKVRELAARLRTK